MPKCLPIHDLAKGEMAQIVDLVGKPLHVSRLCEIGLRVGATLQMLQSGMACVVRLNGTKLCVRPSLVQILVQPR